MIFLKLDVIPTPGEEGSDGTFHALPVEQLGCWSDAGYTPKALQDVEHILKQLWPEDVSIQFREKPIVLCFGTAKYMGRKIFAVQNGGECFAEGPTYDPLWKGDYKIYGSSDQCKSDGKGGRYANEVYGWIRQGADGWGRIFFHLPIENYRLFVICSKSICIKLTL